MFIKHSKVSTVGVFLLCVLCIFQVRAEESGDISLHFLANVPAGENDFSHGSISMSPSGKTLALFYPKLDYFNVICYDERLRQIQIVKQPSRQGLYSSGWNIEWVSGGQIAFTDRSGERNLLALPYAAWTEEDEALIRRETRVHFEDGTGRTVEPGDRFRMPRCGDGTPKLGPVELPKLFAVEGESRMEVTTTDAPPGMYAQVVSSFQYDFLKKRVGVRGGNCYIVLDIDSGIRTFLPVLQERKNPPREAYIEYHLIPGEDFLIAMKTPYEDSRGSHEEIYSLKLVRMDGQVVSGIPISFRNIEEDYLIPDQITVSRYLLAFRTSNGGAGPSMIKVYEIVRGAEE